MKDLSVVQWLRDEVEKMTIWLPPEADTRALWEALDAVESVLTYGEIMKCIECCSEENLIESGGQFQGGVWFICSTCKEKNDRTTEFMKTEEFQEVFNKVVEKLYGK